MAGASSAGAAAAGGAAVSALGASVLAASEGMVLGALGFTPLGPAAGSYAAGWMSSIALSNGVGVTAGSWYSVLQASAMGGGAVLGAPFVIGTGVVGGVVALTAVGMMKRGRSGGAADGPAKHVNDAGVNAFSASIAEGPWGGSGGLEFTEGTGDITEIVVFHNEFQVVALEVQYHSGGSIFKGRKYGGEEENFSKIILEPENEYISRVLGTYSISNGIQIITSITFVSNKAVYGPFGTELGSSFSSSGSGKVIGFFGRSGSFIDQIGIYRVSVSKDMFEEPELSLKSQNSEELELSEEEDNESEPEQPE